MPTMCQRIKTQYKIYFGDKGVNFDSETELRM